jgi:SRSO17 transposase
MLAVMEGSRAGAADAHAAWSESFNELFAQVAGIFSNAHVRRHGRSYVLGLLSYTERKNSWQLAEFAGQPSPDGLQRLLNFSPWDEDACRDAIARYVVRSMGDPGAVLAVDETGFLKKAGCPLGWPGNIPGRRAGWRTARSACSSRTARRAGRGR